jgi:hypothetical protein
MNSRLRKWSWSEQRSRTGVRVCVLMELGWGLEREIMMVIEGGDLIYMRFTVIKPHLCLALPRILARLRSLIVDDQSSERYWSVYVPSGLPQSRRTGIFVLRYTVRLFCSRPSCVDMGK